MRIRGDPIGWADYRAKERDVNFFTEFMPHGHCYAWTPAILWASVSSDVMHRDLATSRSRSRCSTSCASARTCRSAGCSRCSACSSSRAARVMCSRCEHLARRVRRPGDRQDDHRGGVDRHRGRRCGRSCRARSRCRARTSSPTERVAARRDPHRELAERALQEQAREPRRRASARRRRPREEPVPRQHEPRDPHAAERRHRPDRARCSTRDLTREQREHVRTVIDSGERRCSRSSTTSSTTRRSRPARSSSRACAFDLDDVRAATRCARFAVRARRQGLELLCLARRRRAARRCAAIRAGCARCSRTWSANAIKFTESGEVVAGARSTARTNGAACASRCATPGIGIDAGAVDAPVPSRSSRPTSRRRAASAAPASGSRSAAALVDADGRHDRRRRARPARGSTFTIHGAASRRSTTPQAGRPREVAPVAGSRVLIVGRSTRTNRTILASRGAGAWRRWRASARGEASGSCAQAVASGDRDPLAGCWTCACRALDGSRARRAVRRRRSARRSEPRAAHLALARRPICAAARAAIAARRRR